MRPLALGDDEPAGAALAALTRTLGPRALRDIVSGLNSGRFRFDKPAAAVSITGGALPGTIRGVVDGVLGEDADVVHAEAALRMLGLSPQDVARTARLALPEIETGISP